MGGTRRSGQRGTQVLVGPPPAALIAIAHLRRTSGALLAGREQRRLELGWRQQQYGPRGRSAARPSLVCGAPSRWVSAQPPPSMLAPTERPEQAPLKPAPAARCREEHDSEEEQEEAPKVRGSLVCRRRAQRLRRQPLCERNAASCAQPSSLPPALQARKITPSKPRPKKRSAAEAAAEAGNASLMGARCLHPQPAAPPPACSFARRLPSSTAAA